MSMSLMVSAMKSKVGNPLRKLVLIKLADNANDQGECWPSYQHIADQCEIARSTVKNHVRELEKSGFLRREYRKNGAKNQSNIFHLNLGQQITGVGRQITQGRASDNPGGGASDNPRTSHSLEPVSEPVKEPENKPSPTSKMSCPCPVDEILKLWKKVLPEKRQPVPSILKQGQTGKLLNDRWHQCMKIDHSTENRKLYHDEQSGLEFWEGLLNMIRQSEFLMSPQSKWFTFAWLVKKANFEKLIQGDYQ